MFKTNSAAILLATYNGEKFLREQIDSLLAQTYQDFVVFISDDLSTDKTKDIILEYTEKFTGKIIDIWNERHFGNARDNFLNLLCAVDAPYYLFCDQDDVWLNTKVEKTMAIFKNTEKNKPALIYSDLYVVESDLGIINSSFLAYTKKTKTMDWKQYLIENNNVVGCTMAINEPLAMLYKFKAKELDNTNIFMHDSFFAQIASLTGTLYFIDESLVKYRQHGNNSIGAISSKKSIIQILKIIFNLRNKKIIQIQREKNTNEVLKCCCINNDKKYEICTEYSKLYNKRKIQRILFLIKNQIYRQSFFENLYLFLTI